MSLERLKAASKKTVGTKQTVKAIAKGQARVVFVARDAEEHVIRGVLEAAREKGLEIEEVESMAVLGKACGIEVGAAAAAILEG
ncbi:MAG: 50S ribosomal protein L7Ae/L30e/S12e/Gadd45 [Symbiobacterium thermophilum]|uniref:50S ribosomal protein L7Ae/L30e/S12e/Gadd45 n=1 Tax=Symbiobacterium thermophilum TaxID=2734 RepID=A0A1Y2T3R7_SYMTR|nr:MAG: 50S ribosomal protein L7Ae/L30e/S12e/Gadd45 [Symbiobacterium thermophilum]PZN70980.1 MAG: 50S ribosomal protein L7Ae-like protein [Bacillota bacterium]